ncbi:DUF928 domain-containing protein [Spirulina sp. CS-785/01]|uniref:DUF928 domain-containing protein n=1 Tax=Spirulina sp. CS-785/01 TaxID=3021716 RepID=UPI00232E913C|nr:DUF928 domain-containing protein [Spirulina sp. CS-785/01]MDB9315981.1 DUF928 domain-containing protein [Spirulina sp. CS-785/01]
MGLRTLSTLSALPALIGLNLFLRATVTQAIPSYQISVNFPQPSSGGSNVSRTSGGASRAGDSCVVEGEEVTPLTVLMPQDNIGTTLAPDPSLYVYVPQTKATELTAEIVILKEGEETASRFPFNLEEVYVAEALPVPDSLNQGGQIVRYELDGADLEVGETYQWTLAIVCNPDDRSKDEVVKGQFERLEPANLSLVANPSELDPSLLAEKANEYAQNRLWNETLEYTAQLRQYQPNEWENLLQSVDLEHLADIPFAQ